MSHQQYMNHLQNKINYINQINPSTYDFSNPGYQNTFYNSQENGLVGNRPNLPSDYTSASTRQSNQTNYINSSNAYMRR